MDNPARLVLKNGNGVNQVLLLDTKTKSKAVGSRRRI